ncbi:adenine specific DNA methylase Mod (plasmid) [Candidatus Megaera polyxenophila]|nr:adenine specific DNA methylase Mod [Candidatus Megaera polyxenophila]BBB57808.1 adenine specific DNA methylase Mod [Candidatus Megaera polyxenophila]
MNILYYGDNLYVMKQKLKKDSVDLIYLDPPFNSKRNYNMMYKAMTGYPVSESAEAFCDTWTLNAEKEDKLRNMEVLMKEYDIDDTYVVFWSTWIKALRNTQPALLAYLVYMVERLLHMKVILRPTGSIYLHCDPTASHYIKVMMDGIFGHQNFKNEIIWCYKTGGRSTKFFPKKHDIILWYSKSNQYTFNYNDVCIQRDFSTMHEPTFIDEEGKIYQRNIKNGKEYRYYQDQGVLPNDYWIDIQALNPSSKERLGYPTQKPIALLDRIIKASCPPDGVVFDPFCGCGTTIYSALKNQRKWIGCDIAMLPIILIKHQLTEKYRLVETEHFEIDGVPVSFEQAEVLMKYSPHQFQHWAIEQVKGLPTKQKSGDKGIDGRIYIDTTEGLKDMVISVKGGQNITPANIRELRGVLDREDKSVLAGFISLQEPTKGMREEAAQAGIWEYKGIKYDKIQLLTIQEILEDKKTFNTPTKVGIKGTTGQYSLRI